METRLLEYSTGRYADEYDTEQWLVPDDFDEKAFMEELDALWEKSQSKYRTILPMSLPELLTKFGFKRIEMSYKLWTDGGWDDELWFTIGENIEFNRKSECRLVREKVTKAREVQSTQ